MAILKGAFLRFQRGLVGLPVIVMFQFNPETVTRTPSISQEQISGDEVRDPSVVMSAPTESLSFTLRVDATDQLEARNPVAAAHGVLPVLSALELLMYPVPATSTVLTIRQPGSFYTHPPNVLPIVLFFWGPSRVLPVNVTSLSITELEYDPRLNPTRAEVSVSLQVVSPPALEQGSKVMQGAYRYTQSVKEVLAALSIANSISTTGSMTVSL
jgi:hypothetical protein